MLCCDTNLLLPAVERNNQHHSAAAAFLETLQEREDVAVSELVLLELYNLLRNPAVLAKPLRAAEATEVCQAFRHHPRWQVLGFPPDSRAFHQAFWPRLAEPGFARRRSYDWRLALCLVRQGVTEFATVNTKDFQDAGFQRVWNPLSDGRR